jgi:hypothetical protein
MKGTHNHPTGLGEPEPAGKLALFQPPQPDDRVREKVDQQPPQKGRTNPEPSTPTPEKGRRIRTTIDLTVEALQTLQRSQQEYRLKTGKVLPLWKAVSQAVVEYGKKNENAKRSK